MRYCLVVAEDEPAATENISDIIRLYCPEFELVATAENGAECLKIVHKYHPDLLLTDIKMPVMNGLELIKHLYMEMPEIKVIILSGYQDFDFARTAFQYGAIDYLLKPITPHLLRAALNRIIPLINNDRSQKCLNLIQDLLSGGDVNKEELKTFFPASGYIVGLCRKNGLMGRFLGIKRVFPPASSVLENIIDIYGKDEMECIHIEPFNSSLGGIQWNDVPWLNRDTPGYRTIVYSDKPIPIIELSPVIDELYNVLASSLIIGKSQIIPLVPINNKREVSQSVNAPDFLNDTLVNYIKKNRNEKIKEILHEQIISWEKFEIPQFRIEERIRLFLEQIRNVNPEAVNPEDKIEFLVDDAFYYATNYADLEKNLFYILEKLLPQTEQHITKIDTPEFFGLIEEYVKDKIKEPFSLQQACMHIGISQTYMSRLFRKYTGLSFSNYLTRSRIELAKQYLSGGKTLIKDAATIAGFKDQFYFSKVFKSFTGLSPSEYTSNIRIIESC